MATSENHLITLLPRSDRSRLRGLSESVALTLGDVLAEPGQRTRYVYFPVDAFISLVTGIGGKPVLEVGMVGREGMFGVHLLLGVPVAPMHALVQGSGTALRIGAVSFSRELARSKSLRDVGHRYLYVLMTQLATSAACTRFHNVAPRLARWLLMSQDRAHANTFRITQEFLAYMLGVRRVGITAAASQLQRRGLIHYRRGNITVRNRAGLEAAACSCYAADSEVYRQQLV